MASIGTSSFVDSALVKLGLLTGEAIVKISDILTEVNKSVDGDSSKMANPVDNFFINSPSEITSPLVLLYQFIINVLILILIIFLAKYKIK